MKKALYIGLILCAPLLLSAQQKNISQQDLQKQIQEDIKRAIDLNVAGHACDIAAWKTVLELPIKQHSPSEGSENG